MIEIFASLVAAVLSACFALVWLWFTDNYRVKLSVQRIAPPKLEAVEAPNA